MLAFKLFFEKQCYHENQKVLNKAFTVIPVFESEQEHANFIGYIEKNTRKFTSAVESMNIKEIFPNYAQEVDTVVVYKLGKTLVQWLAQWREQQRSD